MRSIYCYFVLSKYFYFLQFFGKFASGNICHVGVFWGRGIRICNKMFQILSTEKSKTLPNENPETNSFKVFVKFHEDQIVEINLFFDFKRCRLSIFSPCLKWIPFHMIAKKSSYLLTPSYVSCSLLFQHICVYFDNNIKRCHVMHVK